MMHICRQSFRRIPRTPVRARFLDIESRLCFQGYRAITTSIPRFSKSPGTIETPYSKDNDPSRETKSTYENDNDPADNSPQSESLSSNISARYSLYRKMLPQAMMITGGVVTIYGTSKLVMWMTSSFMSLNFTNVAMMGFGAGLTSGLICAGIGAGLYRMSMIRPEFVFRQVMKLMRYDKEIQQYIGKDMRGGELRAYRIRPGHIGFSKWNVPMWVNPRVQMLFEVRGKNGVGMASVEAIRKARSLSFTLATVDVLESTQTTHSEPHPMIMVAGDEDRLTVRGQLRGFLQTERVKFIQQKVHDTDV